MGDNSHVPLPLQFTFAHCLLRFCFTMHIFMHQTYSLFHRRTFHSKSSFFMALKTSAMMSSGLLWLRIPRCHFGRLVFCLAEPEVEAAGVERFFPSGIGSKAGVMSAVGIIRSGWALRNSVVNAGAYVKDR